MKQIHLLHSTKVKKEVVRSVFRNKQKTNKKKNMQSLELLRLCHPHPTLFPSLYSVRILVRVTGKGDHFKLNLFQSPVPAQIRPRRSSRERFVLLCKERVSH